MWDPHEERSDPFQDIFIRKHARALPSPSHAVQWNHRRTVITNSWYLPHYLCIPIPMLDPDEDFDPELHDPMIYKDKIDDAFARNVDWLLIESPIAYGGLLQWDFIGRGLAGIAYYAGFICTFVCYFWPEVRWAHAPLAMIAVTTAGLWELTDRFHHRCDYWIEDDPVQLSRFPMKTFKRYPLVYRRRMYWWHYGYIYVHRLIASWAGFYSLTYCLFPIHNNCTWSIFPIIIRDLMDEARDYYVRYNFS